MPLPAPLFWVELRLSPRRFLQKTPTIHIVFYVLLLEQETLERGRYTGTLQECYANVFQLEFKLSLSVSTSTRSSCGYQHLVVEDQLTRQAHCPISVAYHQYRVSFDSSIICSVREVTRAYQYRLSISGTRLGSEKLSDGFKDLVGTSSRWSRAVCGWILTGWAWCKMVKQETDLQSDYVLESG